MFQVGPGELMVILLLALIIFGPGKLPDVGRALGMTINEFRRASREREEVTGAEQRQAGRGNPPDGPSPTAPGRPEA